MMPSRTSKVRFSPRKRCITLLEVFHDAQRMQVVIEDSRRAAHSRIERLLTRMTKWRMPNVMHQRQRLGRSTLRFSAAAMVREICSTSMV